MSIEPGDEIGEEVHDIDQFIRIEAGRATVMLDGAEHQLEDDWAVVIPAGTRHNLINTGDIPVKLYSVYSPPEHKDGTVHPTRPHCPCPTPGRPSRRGSSMPSSRTSSSKSKRTMARPCSSGSASWRSRRRRTASASTTSSRPTSTIRCPSDPSPRRDEARRTFPRRPQQAVSPESPSAGRCRRDPSRRRKADAARDESEPSGGARRPRHPSRPACGALAHKQSGPRPQSAAPGRLSERPPPRARHRSAVGSENARERALRPRADPVSQ